jgi:hypothetical protein
MMKNPPPPEGEPIPRTWLRDREKNFLPSETGDVDLGAWNTEDSEDPFGVMTPHEFSIRSCPSCQSPVEVEDVSEKPCGVWYVAKEVNADCCHSTSAWFKSDARFYPIIYRCPTCGWSGIPYRALDDRFASFLPSGGSESDGDEVNPEPEASPAVGGEVPTVIV